MTYWDRLYHLNLQSLQRRRDRYSMIQVWKTYNNLVPNSTQMKFSEGARLGPQVAIPPYNYRAQRSKASLLEHPSESGEVSYGKHQGFHIIGDSKRAAWPLPVRNPRLAAHNLIFSRAQQFLARVGKKTWGPVSGRSPVGGKN